MNYEISEEDLSRLLHLADSEGSDETLAFLRTITGSSYTPGDTPSGKMCCPTCEGTGMVDENFLTEELVGDVTKEWCIINHKDFGYGVVSFSDYSDAVHVTCDTTCRSCYSTETYHIPRMFFVRDTARRKVMFDLEKARIQEEKARKQREEDQRRLATIQRELDALKRKLDQ